MCISYADLKMVDGEIFFQFKNSQTINAQFSIISIRVVLMAKY